MAEIRDIIALKDWLKGQPVEFACVLAARIALRIVPVFELVLHNDDADIRREIIMSNFRALIAVNYAGAWPEQAESIGDAVWKSIQEAADMTGERFNQTQINLIEAQEVTDYEIKSLEMISQLQHDAFALDVAVQALNASVEATQSVLAFLDVAKGIANSASLFEATSSVTKSAENAVNNIHYVPEPFDDFPDGLDKDEHDIAPHIEEFWNAITLDIEQLCVDKNPELKPRRAVKNLSEKALWLGDMPIWVSRRWTHFKHKLPSEEGWQVWINWYEARLAGKKLDVVLEIEFLRIPDEEWKKDPDYINAIIEGLIESRSDPLLDAVAAGFEELDTVRQHASIDLTIYMERIKSALPNDPYLAIGSAKEMLEATMKTILDSRGTGETDQLNFPALTVRCLIELGLKGRSPPVNESERHLRKIAANAQKMIETVNEFRNQAGTGHGRVVGREPIITPADASLVASVAMILAAWLLRHNMGNSPRFRKSPE